jgi:hypothetical protein
MNALTKKVAPLFLCATSLVLTSPAQAAKPEFLNVIKDFYFGIDEQVKRVQFETGYGKGMFAETYRQTSPFVGVKFNDYFGVEAGYKITHSKTRVSELHGGDTQLGVGLGNRVNLISDRNKYKAKGPYINLVGYYPIFNGDTYLFGSVGISRIKHQIDSTPIAYGVYIRRAEMDGKTNESVRKFSKTKITPQLTFGIQHLITKHIGIRTHIGIEQSRTTLNTNAYDIGHRNDTQYTVKLKNSTYLGVGFFINL